MGGRLTQLIGRIVWPLIKNSSKVTFDKKSGKVSKVYQPRIFVKILSFLTFQKWIFLYETEIGLQIAGYRREIVNYVLRYHMEGRCRVASFLGIKSQENKPALITELIEGREPNPDEVSRLLRELTTLFPKVGLPTWSICSYNPRAYTNIMIGSDQMPVIVDLESLLPSIFVPLEEWRDNIKVGNFPAHDDMCFSKLWQFYRQVQNSLDDNGRRLKFCIQECERLTKEQKNHELRLLSRILNILLTILRAGKE